MTRGAAQCLRGTFAARVVVAWCACVLAGAGTLAAQQADGISSGRPFRGLFGANQPQGAGGGGGPHSLVLTGSLYAGYDDDIFARGRGLRTSNARLGGRFAGAQVGASYGLRGPRSTFSLSSGAALRYLPQSDEFIPTFYSASVGVTRDLGPRTTIGFQHRAAYRPFFSVVPFADQSTLGSSFADAGDVVDGDPLGGDLGGGAPDDFTLSADRRAVQQTGNLRLSHRLTPRSGLSFRAGYGFADFQSSEFDDVNNTRWRAQGNYNYDLTRYLQLQLGYGYQRFAARRGPGAENHNINLGVRYGQPFVLQRGRTRLSFSTGTSLLARERLQEEANDTRRLVLRATGTASLIHAFSNAWQAQAVYTRSVGFLDGLGRAVQGDSIMGGVGGLLNRRTDVQASVGYVSGAIGLRERNFDTAMASVRVRTALTETVALFAQYFYYQYAFSGDVVETLIVAPELERQGVRAGLTFWVPLIR